MNSRLERILREQAQRHAPYLLANPPVDQTWLVQLADGLARNGVLVILGEVGAQNYQNPIQTWMGLYSSFYRLLAQALFSMYSGHQLGTADREFPPVLVLLGDSAPVVQVMGSYVVPFVAYAQQRGVSGMELNGTMNLILKALEAGDLPPELQAELRKRGVDLLRRIVQVQVRQHALTSSARPLLEELQRQTRSAPPNTLPEELPEPPSNGTTDTQQMFLSDLVPIFYKKGDSERFPPIRRPGNNNNNKK